MKDLLDYLFKFQTINSQYFHSIYTNNYAELYRWTHLL